MNCCGIKNNNYYNKNIQNYKIKKNFTDKECLICLDEFKKNQELSVIINCGHYYHHKCLSKWFKKKEVCPLCNIDLK